MFISCDFRVALSLALKAGFLKLCAGGVVLFALIMFLSANFGGRQPVTVALDVGISFLRLFVPLVVVFLAQEFFFREVDKKYYLFSLSCPRERSVFLLWRFFSVFILALSALFFFGLFQVLFIDLLSGVYRQGGWLGVGIEYIIVQVFFGFELLLLSSLAVLLSVFASTSSFVLIGTFGFILVARSYGSIIELLGNQAGLVSNPEGYRASLGVLGYLLPDIGALDIRMLVLYGKSEFLPSDWQWLLLSSLGYVVTLLAIAVWALQRKRFA